MEQYNKIKFKDSKKKNSKKISAPLNSIQSTLGAVPEVDLAWHVRAWGWWVLQEAKKELEQYYPIINEKPSIAYLWACTVTCKNCRATIPLLKTRWLSKKNEKRVLLTIIPNEEKTGVVFGIQNDVPIKGRTSAEKRECDKRLGQGTVSRNGAWCPCCGKPGTVAMTREDIQHEGINKNLGVFLTSIVCNSPSGKEYRLPTLQEKQAILKADEDLPFIFSKIPFGRPQELITIDGKGRYLVRSIWF